MLISHQPSDVVGGGQSHGSLLSAEPQRPQRTAADGRAHKGRGSKELPPAGSLCPGLLGARQSPLPSPWGRATPQTGKKGCGGSLPLPQGGLRGWGSVLHPCLAGVCGPRPVAPGRGRHQEGDADTPDTPGWQSAAWCPVASAATTVPRTGTALLEHPVTWCVSLDAGHWGSVPMA